MDDSLKKLRETESELELELSQNPLFKDLEAIRLSIAILERRGSVNGRQTASQLTEVPKEYSDSLSWREKILVALGKLKLATPIEVVAELKRLGDTNSDEWLQKRVSVMLSYMKRKKIVGIKTVEKKTKYFIK